MKAFSFGKWHAWEGTVGVLLSDEDQKKLLQFDDVDTCITYLYVNVGDKEAARALNKHVKGE